MRWPAYRYPRVRAEMVAQAAISDVETPIRVKGVRAGRAHALDELNPGRAMRTRANREDRSWKRSRRTRWK